MKKPSELPSEDPILQALKKKAVQDYIANRPERPILFDVTSSEYKQVEEEVSFLEELIESKKGSADVLEFDLNRAKSSLGNIKRMLRDSRSMTLENIRKSIKETKTELNRLEQHNHLKRLNKSQNPFSDDSFEEKERTRHDAELAMELLDAVMRAKKPKGFSSREESQWEKVATQAKGLRSQFGGNIPYKEFVGEVSEIAERSAQLQKIPGKYFDRFLGIRNRLDIRAKALGERVTEELFKKIKPDLMELARRDSEPAELDAAIDEILVSAF